MLKKSLVSFLVVFGSVALLSSCALYKHRTQDSAVITGTTSNGEFNGIQGAAYDFATITNIGVVPEPDALGAAAIQADGKIITGGWSIADPAGYSDFALIRYNSDGTLDVNFGKNGKVLTDIKNGSSDTITSIAVQSDAKIVVAGYSNAIAPGDPEGSNRDSFAVARYNADGTLDSSFGTAGIVLTDAGNGSNTDRATSLVIQADGKIVAGGYSYFSDHNDFTVVRYNSNGTLDDSFGQNGVVQTNIEGNGYNMINCLALQADGKIVAGGYDFTKFALVRYNTDGSLDGSFGSAGVVTTSVGWHNTNGPNSIVIQPNGQILAGGSTDANGSMDFMLVRYNSNGDLDAAFGAGGVVLTDIGGGDSITALALQANGKILAVGPSSTADTNQFALVRYNSDGSFDKGFGSEGKVLTTIGSGLFGSVPSSIILLSSAQIIVGAHTVMVGPYGGWGMDFALVKYNSDGSLDEDFADSGMAVTDIGRNSDDYMTSVAVQADGKIVAGGSTNAKGVPEFIVDSVESETIEYNMFVNGGGGNDFALVRYNDDGTIDASFGVNGAVLTDIGKNSDDYIGSIAIQSDGKILAAGQSNANGSGYDFVIVRYNKDGSLDKKFGKTGKVITDIAENSDDSINSIAIQSDGKIVAAGRTSAQDGNSDFAIVRYNSDGSLDKKFGGTGIVVTDIGDGDDDSINSVAIQSDGKIVAGGTSGSGKGISDFALVRYNSDGSLDKSFGTDGKALTSFGDNVSNGLSSIALQPDGKIVAAGSTSDGKSKGSSDFAIARYNSDGSLDKDFGSAGQVVTAVGGDSYISTLGIQSTGKIVVGGSFYDGNGSVLAMARYNSDGSLDERFATGGIGNPSLGTEGDAQITCMAIEANDKIIVGGSYNLNFDGNFALMKF